MLPDFDSMTHKELKVYAKENNIDLEQAKKKDDILDAIKKYYNIDEEEVKMEEKDLMANEMQGNQEVVDSNVPADAVPEAATTSTRHRDTRVWEDSEGNEISMSQFIREKFTKDNMSRKEISEQFEINYRTVYGATVNMTNAAEPASRGRGAVNPKIEVTADGKVLSNETVGEGDAAVTKYFLNGEEIKPDDEGNLYLPEVTETDRNSWIKEQVDNGVSRGDVAKILNLSYGVVYGLTKEAAGTRQKYEMEIDDPENPGQKKTISRSEYIRMRVAEGMSKSDVAKELNVEYSVVWQATKQDKTEAEKYEGIIESLEKLADKIDNPEGSGNKEAFVAAVAALKAFTIAEEKPADKAEDTAANDAVEGNTEA